jgi:hypothetical protein
MKLQLTSLLDVSDGLRILLAEELVNEDEFTPGEIFRKIRMYTLAQDPLGAARWWPRLPKNQRFELERFLRRKDFMAPFDALLDIPGLWHQGLRLGVTKAVLDLKCDEVSNLRFFYTFIH